MRPQTLTVPCSLPVMNSNHRPHWTVKAGQTKAWRDMAYWTALNVLAPYSPDEQVHITATFHRPTARKYDPANWYPTVKAVIDGLVDAGILVDDDHAHVLGPDMRAGEKRNPPVIVLTLEVVQP